MKNSEGKEVSASHFLSSDAQQQHNSTSQNSHLFTSLSLGHIAHTLHSGFRTVIVPSVPLKVAVLLCRLWAQHPRRIKNFKGAQLVPSDSMRKCCFYVTFMDRNARMGLISTAQIPSISISGVAVQIINDPTSRFPTVRVTSSPKSRTRFTFLLSDCDPESLRDSPVQSQNRMMANSVRRWIACLCVWHTGSSVTRSCSTPTSKKILLLRRVGIIRFALYGVSLRSCASLHAVL